MTTYDKSLSPILVKCIIERRRKLVTRTRSYVTGGFARGKERGPVMRYRNVHSKHFQNKCATYNTLKMFLTNHLTQLLIFF